MLHLVAILWLVQMFRVFHGQISGIAVPYSTFAYVLPPIFPPLQHSILLIFLLPPLPFFLLLLLFFFLGSDYAPSYFSTSCLGFICSSSICSSSSFDFGFCFCSSNICCFSSFLFCCSSLFASSFNFLIVTLGFDFRCALPLGFGGQCLGEIRLLLRRGHLSFSLILWVLQLDIHSPEGFWCVASDYRLLHLEFIPCCNQVPHREHQVSSTVHQAG